MSIGLRQVSASLLVATLLTGGVVPSVQAQSLYDRIKSQTERELLKQGDNPKTDPVVDEYLTEVYEPDEGPISRANIPLALQDSEKFCLEQDIKQFGRCPIVQQTVQRLVGTEMQPRHLGLHLNILAQSYEQALLGSDTLQSFPARAQGILRIWQPGFPSVGSGAFRERLRSMTVPESGDMEQKFKDLVGKLSALPGPSGSGGSDNSSLIGAGWRYRFGGVHFLKGDRTQYFDPPLEDTDAVGTERQYMFARWTEVEDKLLAIEDALPPDSDIDPPLGTGEILIYQFPKKYQATLPEHLRVWAYREFHTVDKQIDGDIGLTFDHALEPVLPALCEDEDEITTGRTDCEPIKGGFYPPPPSEEPDPALCTHPYMRQGYMCRPLDDDQATQCIEKVDPKPDEITLTRCTATGSVRGTLTGPDACLDTTWFKEKPFDPEKQCKVEIVCDDSSPFSGGVTELKQADGTIKIKMKVQPDGPASYIILHEITHARQACGHEPGYAIYSPSPIEGGDSDQVRLEKNRGCCQMEGEAYRLQAEAMEADGIFREGDQFNGIPINRETFWQVTLDFSCRQRGYGSCPNTFTYDPAPAESQKNPPAWMMQFIQYVVNTLAPPRRPNWMPMSCTETMTPPKFDSLGPEDQLRKDPRIDGFLRELSEVGREVCAPKSETEYVNSIGNNACFFDRCLERSFEAHNTVGGRQALTTYDQAYPQGPLAKEQQNFATLLALPSFQPFTLADYRPAFLVKIFDQVFCDGLAPQGLPVLCIQRHPRSANAIGRTADTLVQTRAEENDARAQEIQLSQELATAVGLRMGNRLYAKYLGFRSAQLATIVQAATRYLTAFTKVEFPQEMCPMGPYVIPGTTAP